MDQDVSGENTKVMFDGSEVWDNSNSVETVPTKAAYSMLVLTSIKTFKH